MYYHFGSIFLLCKVGGVEKYFARLLQGMEFPVMVNAAREVLGELSVKLPIGHSSRVTFRSRRSRWFIDPRFQKFLCENNITHEFVDKAFAIDPASYGQLTEHINSAHSIRVCGSEE